MLRIILIFGVFFSIEALMHDDHHQESLNRTKRYLLVFPPNSATGVLIALAIPLDLPHRAVFVSYNFETNFNPPQKTTDYTQGILQKFPSTQAPNGAFPTGDGERRNFDTGLITRKSMYKMVEDHVGRGCLLRTICDAANEPIGRHNGIVGDLIHVVFSYVYFYQVIQGHSF